MNYMHQHSIKMEDEKKTEKERVRKARSAKGTRSQKMMAFRIDNDVADWLATKPNKGLTVNECLRGRMEFETTLS